MNGWDNYQHVPADLPVSDPYGEVRIPVSDIARRLGLQPYEIAQALQERRLGLRCVVYPQSPVVTLPARRVG